MKRQKNDLAVAMAIAEATLRPAMRTVPVKTAEHQSRECCFVSANFWWYNAPDW